MPERILTVIPCCDADSEQAERLIDWIYQIAGKKPYGHAVLVLAANVHPELRMRCEISCELAFERFEIIQAAALASNRKADQINHLFRFAANHVRGYRWPFLWLEPDCVPLKKGWLKALEKFYFDQPKKFAGAFLKRGDFIHLSRTAIYDQSVASLFREEMIVPFEVAMAAKIVHQSEKCRLIQHGQYDDATEIREDAVLFHSDKTGNLIRRLREGRLKPA